jgi:cytochrome c oxidase cbb3-type subunit II
MQFRSFVTKIALCFAAPWLCLVVWPALVQYPSLAPVAYDKDAGDELDSAYSYPLSGINSNGAAIYASEGCVQCHTQMIRNPANTLDGWRKNWGASDESVPARATGLRDYLSEQHAFLGITRNGPDLTNVGYRYNNDVDLHMHLYAPQIRNKWSTAPSYQHLYETRLIQGQGSPEALPLQGSAYAPPAGKEVVPTGAARQLVSYLRSLKRDYALPVSIAPSATLAKKK